MTREEINNKASHIEASIKTLLPEVERYITDIVLRLTDGISTSLDFREWGWDTGGNDGCTIPAPEGKHGPRGEGPVIGFKIINVNGEQKFLAVISTDFSNISTNVDNLSLQELLQVADVLDGLVKDLSEENPEWKVNNDGEVVYTK